MGKAREFYIEQTKISYMVGEPVYRVIDRPQSLLEERTSVCCFHTIEKSAYDKAVEALKWYAQGGPVWSVHSKTMEPTFSSHEAKLAQTTLRELGEIE